MGAPFSTENNIVAKIAGSAIAANTAVKLDTTEGQVIPTTAITDQVFGIAKQAAAAGQSLSIEVGNGAQCRVTVGAAVTLGAQLMPQAAGAGKVIASAGGTAVDCGTALMAAGGSGETIVMRFNPTGKSPANT